MEQQPLTPAQVKALLRAGIRTSPSDPPRSNTAASLLAALEQLVDTLSINTWVPQFGVVSHGGGQVWRVTDWTGGQGPKPDGRPYLGGPNGYTYNIAEAIDCSGNDAWSPVLKSALIPSAGNTWVEGVGLQVTDWVGGQGPKPAIGGFIGSSGIVSDASLATSFRGASWFASDTVPLDLGAPGSFGQRGDLCLNTLTGDVYRCEFGSGRWILRGNLRGIPGLNWRGAWAADTLYAVGDIVSVAGSAFVRKVAGSSGSTFSGAGANWDPFVSKGDKGDQGFRGWTMVTVDVPDGNRVVRRVLDYIGGEGPKPADYIGQYLTSTGFTNNIALAQDVRGPQGLKGDPGTLTASAFVDILPLSTDKLVYQRADGSLGKSDPSTGYPATRPTLLLDFAGAGMVSPLIQHTRSGILSYFDRMGVMRYAPANVPALDYDPATSKCLGLSAWGARTNLVRNSMMVGAVAGSPGTLPNNWAVDQGYGGAIGFSSVALSNDMGVTCVDLGFTGSTVNGNYLLLNTDNASYPVSAGQQFVYTIYAKLVSGATGGNKIGIQINWLDSSNATLSSLNLASQSLSNTLTKFAVAGTAPANTVRARVWVFLDGAQASTAYTFVLRLGAPQAEVGGLLSTPFIPTSGASASRTISNHYIDLLSTWFRQGGGSFYVEVQQGTNAQNDGAAFDLWQDPNNKLSLRSSQLLLATSGVGGIGGGGYPQGSLQRLAFRYAQGDVKMYRNGSLSTTLAPTAIAQGFTRLYLGTTDAASIPLNGYIRAIRYYPALLTDSELIAITSY